jgi:hypothetical protein
MTFYVAGAIVGAGALGAYAASQGAGEQADASRYAADLQYAQYKQTREDQMPWMEAGKGALNKLIPLASEYTPFGMDQFKADPGYAFRMSEGMKGLERSAAARGGLLSGGMLKGIQRYGQDLASQEYQNAFNRYGVERERRLAPLQSLAGVGQTTATQLGQAGQTMASSVGDSMQSAAAARASGYVGTANALTGALNTGLNYYQTQQMMNRLTPTPVTYGGG